MILWDIADETDGLDSDRFMSIFVTSRSLIRFGPPMISGQLDSESPNYSLLNRRFIRAGFWPSLKGDIAAIRTHDESLFSLLHQVLPTIQTSVQPSRMVLHYVWTYSKCYMVLHLFLPNCYKIIIYHSPVLHYGFLEHCFSPTDGEWVTRFAHSHRLWHLIVWVWITMNLFSKGNIVI